METVSLAIASVYLYWSGGVGKFEFVFIRGLPGVYLSLRFCVKAVSMSWGKTTTWVALDSRRPLTPVPLQMEEGNKLQFME